MTETIEQIRARFQPKTRGGYEYEIFAERDTILYGRLIADGSALVWDETGSRIGLGVSTCDLIPRSPHEELISRAREIKDRLPWVEEPDIANVLVALIEALEQEIKK